MKEQTLTLTVEVPKDLSPGVAQAMVDRLLRLALTHRYLLEDSPNSFDQELYGVVKDVTVVDVRPAGEGLRPFVVTLRSAEGWEYLFPCQAEDRAHALEQALDAYPEDRAIKVEEE